MKKTGKVIKDSQKGTEQGRMNLLKSDTSWLFAGLFFFSALYFYFFGNYLFFYQENLSLFIYTGDYFHQFTVKPGGLLEYLGIFLTQGYFNSVYGSVIISSVYTLLAVVFLKIIKQLIPDTAFSMPLAVIPSCLLLLEQINFNWLIHFNLGFLFASFAFLISISSEKKIHRISVIGLFPLFYYFAGAYAWLFLGMYILYALLNKKFKDSLAMVIVSALSLIIFKSAIFLQPYSGLLLYPLPLKEYFINPLFLYLLSGFIILIPLNVKAVSMIKIKSEYQRSISNYIVLLIFAITFFSQSRIYNPNTADLFKIENFFHEQDWDAVIEHQEESQSVNLVAQYYYNIALAEKDLLCDRMFFSRQDFGTRSIIIPWDSKTTISVIFRGVYFFYSIGLINEAHRWAFESMVIQGYTPENIKLLIKTELIRGHYKVAEKYIYILKRTLHYRSFAKKYESMLFHPELVQADPELGAKILLQPKVDFPISLKKPQLNVLFLQQSNPGNRKAFEYKMAWFMLEKNVTGVVSETGKLKEIGYQRIPRHIEEALLFSVSNIGMKPDLAGFKINPESESRFSAYESSVMLMKRDKTSASSVIEKSLRNTYWYYLDSK